MVTGTLLILLENYYNRVIFNYQTFKADYKIPPNDFESIGARKIRKSKFWGATYFFSKFHMIFNFDYQTTKVDYQTPPNDSRKKFS